MIDKFSAFTDGLTSPATAAEEIVPNDIEALEFVTRALYIGQSGDVNVMMKSGETVVLRNMQASVFYPLRVVQVLATGTTATDIVGLR